MSGSTSEPGSKTCLACGTPLAKDAVEGICPRCLLGRALALADAAGDGSDADAELIAASGLEGRTLGGYEILGTLAQGGMGVVFRARQRNPARVVALKVISAGELATRRMVERFHNEALAAARLDHPNIVPIHEVGEDRGWHFFSMQLIEGRTLADLIRDARPGPREAVALLLKVARAVEHAHRRGILHRDLKPTNILIDAGGEPRLTDFGLAKVTEQESDLTQTYAVLGTPAYMSPEQAAGRSRDISTATDVYGLGAILYELLSGRPPFRAEGTPALLRRIVEEDPEPLPALPGLDDLRVICFRCLEKEPARRYATAGELADELERWQRHEPIRARPAGAWERTRKWMRRHPARAALAGTVIAAGLALGAVSLGYNVRLDRARDRAVSNERRSHEQLVQEHLHEAGRAAAEGDALTGLFSLTAALRLEEERATPRPDIRRRIGLTLRSSPHLVRAWAAGGVPYRMAFSSDGGRLTAFCHGGRLLIWELNGGKNRLQEPAPGERTHGVVIAPHGAHAVESLVDAPYVRILRLESGTMEPVSVGEHCGGAVTYNGSGSWILTGGGRLRAWDAVTLREVTLPVSAEGSWHRLATSRDDRWVLALKASGEGVLLDLRAGKRVVPTDPIHAPANPMPLFSDDGHWLLTFDHTEAHLLELGTGERRLTIPYSGLAFSASFSPDGRFLAMASFRDQTRVWALPGEPGGAGPAPHRLPLRHETGANQVCFSPDSRMLATAGFDYQLRLVHAGRHQAMAPVLHHTALVESVAFSPDGRLLATADARGLVRVWDLQPRGVTPLPGLAAMPAPVLTPDGRHVVARSHGNALRIWDTSTGRAEEGPLAGPTPDAEPEPGEPPREDSGAPLGLALDPGGRQVAAALGTAGVRLWDLATRTASQSWTGVGSMVSVAFAPDGQALAAGSSEGVVRRWDLRTGKETAPMIHADEPVRRLAWAPDGKWLAVSGDRSVRVWDAVTGRPLSEARPFPDSIEGLEVSPDGSHLVVAVGNGAIRPGAALVVKAPGMEELHSLLQHGDGVAAAVCSTDRRWIATGGEDNVVRLWRAADFSVVGRPLRHESIVRALHFDAPGDWLAAGGNDGRLRLWTVPGGELAGPALALAGRLTCVRFTPDGNRVLAASPSENSWIVDLSPDPRPVEEIERIARAHTALRPGPGGVLEPVSPAELSRESATAAEGDLAGPLDPARGRWHEMMAVDAEAAGNAFTAAFHLQHLMALRPSDPGVRERWERARSRSASRPK